MAGTEVMQRVLVVGLAVTLLLGCGKSKVVSSGTGGSGGTPAMPGGGDGAPNELTDGPIEHAEPDTGEPVDLPHVVNDADAIGADQTSVAADAGGDVIEPCSDRSTLGILCSGYCNDVADACPDLFADFEACFEVCNAPAWSCGSTGATSGNTLNCRSTHAMAAAASPSAAATECPNAGPNSTSCL